MTQSQESALNAYRFRAEVGDKSKALRELIRAGLESFAAGSDPVKAEAARYALGLWADEDDENKEG